ncbi:MAG: glycosyl transferase [Abditibacteriota bacterium]|nr:glycosyl transferase [Abditibacteriota bacterium]
MENIFRFAAKEAVWHELLNWMPDEPYVKFLYWAFMKKKLDLEDPKTYNEKLQWLKLYDRNPEYTKLVDKYEAKLYVASRIGEEYIIPSYGIWNSPEEIDFDKLPDRFVLKTTHDSGGIKIINKAEGFDRNAINAFFAKRLKQSTYKKQREWPYKNVKPRILAEQYMEDEKTGELRDYKFFCFNGEVKALFIATDRQSKDRPTAFDFFDTDYNWLDVRHGHPNAPRKPDKPETFDKMLELAGILSEGLVHVRVDLYEINGKVYFGEMTFFHHGGIVPFDPEEWDLKFGQWLTLPAKPTKA